MKPRTVEWDCTFSNKFRFQGYSIYPYNLSCVFHSIIGWCVHWSRHGYKPCNRRCLIWRCLIGLCLNRHCLIQRCLNRRCLTQCCQIWRCLIQRCMLQVSTHYYTIGHVQLYVHTSVQYSYRIRIRQKGMHRSSLLVWWRNWMPHNPLFPGWFDEKD